MVPPSKALPDEEDVGKSVRITTTVDYIDSKIIENLQGTFGNSNSSVISHIIKDWIKTNSEKLTKDYGIDIAGFRREIQSKFMGAEIDEEVRARVLEELPQKLKRIKKHNIDKLADHLRIHRKTLEHIIMNEGDELEKAGIILIIDGEFIVNYSLINATEPLIKK